MDHRDARPEPAATESRAPVSDTARTLVIAAVGWCLLAYLLVYHVREVTKIRTWVHSGFRETQLCRLPADPSIVVFQSVTPSDFERPVCPDAGDTVIAINDTAVGRWREYPCRADWPLPIAYLHHGDTLRNAFAMHPPSELLAWGTRLCGILRFLVSLCSLGVGLWALRSQRKSPVIRLFALYSFAVAAVVSLRYFFFPASYATFSIPFQVPLFNLGFLLGTLCGPLWLHVLYLHPRPLNWVRRHPLPAYTICYLPSLLLVALWMNSEMLGALVPFLAGPGRVNLASSVVSAIPVLIALGVLIYRYQGARDQLEARQLRLILWAVAAGIVIQNAIGLISHLSPVWYSARFSHSLGLGTLMFSALLLGPLSFAYAFRKYRLMDVEARLRRGTRYALVAGALFTVLIGVAYIVSEFLVSGLGITSRVPGMAVVFALAIGVLPVQRRILRLVELHLYPARTWLRRTLQEFLHHAAILPDGQTFWNELEKRLREALKVGAVRAVLFGSDAAPFRPESPLMRHLLDLRRPVPVDETLASQRIEVPMDEAAWLNEHGIGLLVPLAGQDGLLGFLAIGLRSDGDDYDAEELRILNSLTPQIVLAGENARLLEENLEKKRLEEELAGARRIQESLLPRELPPTPGLEIAATCRSCLEVAGDYYDVIPLSGGRTAIAIADVSGKGAAAALLMASLHASLLTALRVSSRLESVVAGINELICQSTPPEKYITFFVAIYDPAVSHLTYVNAGHNPPIVVHSDGLHELLETGGLILGVEPRMLYGQGTVRLSENDLLLLYTDGASEAMNAEEKQFGEERMLKFLEDVGPRAAQEILENLEAELIAYRGLPSFEDDLTLVVVRVTGTKVEP